MAFSPLFKGNTLCCTPCLSARQPLPGVTQTRNTILHNPDLKDHFGAIKSRISWLKWGDRNTKFFHATTIQRRNRNRITLLKDANGEWVKEDQPLKEMTETFFKNLYLSMGARDFQPDPLCPICKKEAETTEHALLLCPWTTELWRMSP